MLRGLTQHGAEMLLASGQIKVYGPEQLLFKEGDAATFALLVLAGKLQVFLEREGRDVLLQETKPGTILGELGVLCGIPRSASIRSIGESTVVQWEAAEFRSVLRRNAGFYERLMAQSLRNLIEKERSLIDSMPADQPGGQG